MEEGGQKAKTHRPPVIWWISAKDGMYNVMTVVTTALWYTGKLTKQILEVPITRKRTSFPFFPHLFLLYLYEMLPVK